MISNHAEFVRIVNDPNGQLKDLLQQLKDKCKDKKGLFALCLGSTQTSQLPGISAAGATAELRRLTAAIDAEALVLGHTISGEAIPVSPLGIVSPVVLTRPCLSIAKCPVSIIDCGSFASPSVPTISAGSKIARCVSSGSALELDHVEQLYQSGLTLGESLKNKLNYLVIAECVPGGTTTAMGILTALGLSVRELLSSSIPECNHDARWQLVQEGLKNANLSSENIVKQPLLAVSAVGDPMQPFVSGLAYAAASHMPVILAGGSQMLAVYALIQSILKKDGLQSLDLNLSVVTTKWVAFDPLAQTGVLSNLVAAPFAAACPDLRKSRHAGLRAYEDGNVKEGVGAGAAMALAHLLGDASETEIINAIDHSYDQMLLSKVVYSSS